MPSSPSALLGSWTTIDLLTHLWQSTAVGLAVLILLVTCGRLSARTRRILGWMALAKFVVPVTAITWLVTCINGRPELWLESQTLTLPADVFVAVDTSLADIAPAPNYTGFLVAGVWLAGFAVLYASWLVCGWRWRRRVLVGAVPVSAALAKQIATASLRVGCKGAPRGVAVHNEYGPGVLGFFPPLVILPRGLEGTLAPAELESVLIHELVHLRRRDNFWGAAQAFFVSLFWFHPLVWLLSRRISIETEKSCDERVLEITGDADAYAGGIVKSVRHSLGLPQPGLAGAATPPVAARIRNIFAAGARPNRPILSAGAIVAGVLLLGLSGHTGCFSQGTLKTAAGQTEPALPTKSVVAGGRTFKVGTITIKFAGPMAVDEQMVRANLQLREGVEFDEVSLDRDIRSLYRTGLFEFVEVKHEPVDDKIFNLVVEVTPREKVDSTNQGGASARGGAPGKDAVPRSRDTLSVDFPDEDIRAILRNVADLFKLNLAMPDSVRGKTTIKLRDVTWREIYKIVLGPIGHTFVEDGNIVRVLPISGEFTEQYRAAAGRPEPSLLAETPKTISVDFQDEEIRKILRNVADRYELNLALPDTLQGRTTIKLRDVTWRQIFGTALAPTDYTFIEDGRVVRVVRKVSPRASVADEALGPQPSPTSRQLAGASAGSAGDRELLELLAAQLNPIGMFYIGDRRPFLVIGKNRYQVGAKLNVTEPKSGQACELEVADFDGASFTLRYRNEEITRPIKHWEEIREIIRNVADLFGLNVAIPDSVQGKTTANLRFDPRPASEGPSVWREIFKAVLAPIGHTFVEDGNVIRIVSNESLKPEPVSTEVFLIKYALASDFLPTIMPLVDAVHGGKIVVDARSNALVITERSSRMSRIRPIIENLDRSYTPVLIKARSR